MKTFIIPATPGSYAEVRTGAQSVQHKIVPVIAWEITQFEADDYDDGEIYVCPIGPNGRLVNVVSTRVGG